MHFGVFNKPLNRARLSLTVLVTGSIFWGLTSLVPVHATIVEVRTVAGDFQVNLYDQETPQTVNNFLSYVNAGAYANNVVHRVEPGFVMQAGGFQYNNALPLDNVATGNPVTNEPEFSNLRGTIAMAKQGGDANSATSQWFVNLSDNSTNLDVQNGGFSVFGQVIGEGMQVVDAIADLQRFNLGGAATSIPLRNYTNADASANVEITDDNLVLIHDIVVLDASSSTSSNLNPVPNTLLNAPTPTPTVPEVSASNDSGGGTMAWSLLLLLCVGITRRFKKYI